MAADGNCLFRSISHQIYNDYGTRHEKVRSELCDYLEANEEEFKVFLILDDDDTDICNFKDYVSRMREDGEWGGDVEIVCASRLYRWVRSTRFWNLTVLKIVCFCWIHNCAVDFVFLLDPYHDTSFDFADATRSHTFFKKSNHYHFFLCRSIQYRITRRICVRTQHLTFLSR